MTLWIPASPLKNTEGWWRAGVPRVTQQHRGNSGKKEELEASLVLPPNVCFEVLNFRISLYRRHSLHGGYHTERHSQWDWGPNRKTSEVGEVAQLVLGLQT